MLEMLSAWAEQAKKLEAGEITRGGLRPLALLTTQVRHHPEMGQSPLQELE